MKLANLHRNHWPRDGAETISAKRYALFVHGKNGEPELLRSKVNNDEDRWSEHGLGHLLSPSDPNSEDREWIAQVWLRILRKALGLRTKASTFQKLPAIGRTSVSSPWVMKMLATQNRGKPYAKQIKPFNFLLSAHIAPLGHPIGVDPERFHLIAPFEANPNKWLAQPWIDAHGGKRHRVTTSHVRSAKIAGLTTYGDLLREYEHHEEFKCAAPDGNACTRRTVGLLRRRHVRVATLHFIGKESNLLEGVEEGQVHDLQSAYTEYPDARREREEWASILQLLREAPVSTISVATGLDRRTIQRMQNEGVMPHAGHRKALAKFAQALAGNNSVR